MQRTTLVALVVGVLCHGLGGSVYAQEAATVSGTVLDEQGAVLPGVTITATESRTGSVSIAITDERGEYRLPNLSPGVYSIQADLPGFATMIVPEVELLVGQNASLPFTMQIAGVAETVTVTSETPLVDLSSSEVSGNVDRRQMEALPLQGRNWMELSLLVKGVTANDVADNRPGTQDDEQFQLNLDGQQITQRTASSGFGQPRFSREAIAEFQIVTNQFDITQGRSSGMQVNAITRSGTNTLSGSAYGYFRDDALNSADAVADEVLPFENQQVGGAVGGPLVRDKLMYFASYEHERQPATIFVQPAQLPNQSFTFDQPENQDSLTARVDHNLTAEDRLSYRASYWKFKADFDLGSGDHPSDAALRTQDSFNFLGSWARVLSSEAVMELKVGYNGFEWTNQLATPAVGVCDQSFGSAPLGDAQLTCQPNYVFPGLTVGAPRNFPQLFTQDLVSARLTLDWLKGDHSLKIGGEFLGWKDGGEWHLLERGEFIFDERPNDLERRFPASGALDPSTWDVTGLDALVNRFAQNAGNWVIDIPRPTWAIWLGDTWRATSRLTLNLGVRWDADYGAYAPPHVTTQATFLGPSEGRQAGDLLFKNDIRDLDNVAPRVGFAYDMAGTGDFVIRGGSGLYYTVSSSNITFGQQSFNGERILVNSYPNDGQPGFLEDPTRGVTPTQVLNGEVPVPPQEPRVIAHNFKFPYTWQSSVGFQKQLNQVTGIEVDLIHWKEYNTPMSRDPNQLFDPTTGYNVSSSEGRIDPRYTRIRYMQSTGRQDYLALSTGLTRRFRDNFQGGVTYTLMFFKHDDTTGWGYFPNNHFDPGADWARSTDFQRSTLRLNGIVQLPWNVALAGAYFFGSGNYYATEVSTRGFGTTASDNRLNVGAPVAIPSEVQDRFDGPSVIGTGPGNEVPRNALRGEALHKVDVRLTKTFTFGNVRLSGIAEVFNLFNHDNFGSYNGQITSATFGQPRQNGSNAYVSRSGQLAVRVEF